VTTSLRSLFAALALGLVAAFVPACDPNVPGRLQAQHVGDVSNPPAARGDGSEAIRAACALPPDGQPRAAGAMKRQPYLQQLTDRSGKLVWTAAGEQPATVLLRRADGGAPVAAAVTRDESAQLPAGQRQWVASLEGLSPDTLYCYQLREGEAAVAEAGFRSAPARDGATPARFVVFGDSGEGGEDQHAVLDQVKTVPFDFILHTGDIAYDNGTRSQFEAHFFDVYADLLRLFPVFPASGNHEYETQQAAPFREAFVLPENGGPEGKERWYSYDWGPVHFVVLDTERIGPVQAAWLEADLSAASDRPWTIVYGHKPPFSSGSHGNDAGFQQTFVPILERHHVPLVLSGHDHDYERVKPQNGVTYVVTGGGGRGSRDVGHSSFTAFSESVQHFVYVTATADTLALHAIDGTGAEFDSLVLHRSH
jgi:hypothetical protein